MVDCVAFYLPQYYPTAENDAFWGPGFTEWTNVASARPLFPGHLQPRIPAHLGFYDLRVPETREAQAALAQDHGVSAFCYWHYWFGNGRRVLDRPFREVLESGSPDFPFCLAWANQSWSGIWHGAPGKLLIKQQYPGPADERAHFEEVAEAFADPRYYRVAGRPLFVVFQPHSIPDPLAFTDRWRKWSSDAGLGEPFLAAMASSSWEVSQSGFDAVIIANVIPRRERRRHRGRTWEDLAGTLATRTRLMPAVYSYSKWSPFIPSVHDETDVASFPTVIPNWDNTPRSGRNGVVYVGDSPALFEAQVERAVDLLAGRPDHPQVIFAKSWNEWAEGNVLEPDRRTGLGNLEALQTVLARARRGPGAQQGIGSDLDRVA